MQQMTDTICDHPLYQNSVLKAERSSLIYVKK